LCLPVVSSLRGLLLFRPTVLRIWTGPANQLHRSPALSRSRSPALFPAPLREVSAALWSAERSLDLSSSILEVISNKPRSYPPLFYKLTFSRTSFRSRGNSRFEWFSPLQVRRFPPHQQHRRTFWFFEPDKISKAFRLINCRSAFSHSKI